jgi:aminoglycoside phosphotransferase (APT) family kinase protein
MPRVRHRADRGPPVAVPRPHQAAARVDGLGARGVGARRDVDPQGAGASEARNLAFAASHTSAAVPQVLARWSERGSGFLLVSRIPGTTLEAAWDGMGPAAREEVARAAAGHLRELHAATSIVLSGAGGGPLFNASEFFGCGRDESVGPCGSDDETWAVLAGALETAAELAGEDVQFLRERMPPLSPYVFSHGDLSASNVIVTKGGEFSGFVDFESSGFYPIWWDWVHTREVSSRVDGEWKLELRKHMDCTYGGLNFDRALDWYHYLVQLRVRPGSEAAKQSKKELAEWDLVASKVGE